jgi:hypothetical protein
MSDRNEAYDELLDSIYQEVDVCGYKYAPSDALFRLDPIAYRIGLLEYQDELEDDDEEHFRIMDSEF